MDLGQDEPTLLDLCKSAIARGEKARAKLPVNNITRLVGTNLGDEITKKHWRGPPYHFVRLHGFRSVRRRVKRTRRDRGLPARYLMAGNTVNPRNCAASRRRLSVATISVSPEQIAAARCKASLVRM